MSKDSDAMEQQVARIKQLLEPDGTRVVWNEKIPDPDNPKQLRQIDVGIHRDGKFTHVECRLYSDPQDVGWIEELMGRRVSLGADAMIAVSASGFTEGAILKADAHGILLRNLATVSAAEVKQWGKVTDAELIYYEFKETVLTFTMPRVEVRSLGITNADGSPIQLRGLFQQVMQAMECRPEFRDDWVEVNSDFSSSVLIGGVPATAALIDTMLRRVVRKASLVSVVAYSAAGSATPDTYARVQHFDAAFEVIDAEKEQEVAVVFDLSGVPTPKNCLLRGANFDFGRFISLKWVKPVGVMEAMGFDAIVEVRVKFDGGT